MKSEIIPGRLLWAVFPLLLALHQPVAAQSINSVVVQPSPVCVDRAVDVRINGTGPCAQLRVCYDWDTQTNTCAGGSNCAMNPENLYCVGSPSFPHNIPAYKSYDATGTYTVRASSADCGVASTTVEVVGCVTPGLVPDGALTPIPGRLTRDPVRQGLQDLRPLITDGPFGAPVQPGHEFPFVVFGERLPLPGDNARAILDGSWGTEELEVVALNADGSGAALKVPDNIWGHGDQTAQLTIISGTGWPSNTWPVPFVAARKFKWLPQDDVEVDSCSTESNVDCCNDEYHANYPFRFCLSDSDPSVDAFHFNADHWPLGIDRGTDRYRISLANGWRIDSISFDAEADGTARLGEDMTGGSPGRTTFELEVPWFAFNDAWLYYRGWVLIVGPRGVSHK